MPRRPRLQIVDGMYHLGTRGNRRCTIFHDDDDRVSFLQLLERTVKRAEWICHAWCLMGTHYHLLIETPAETLSSGMEFLNGRYARSFNEKYGLRGPPIREAVLRRADRGRHAARRDGRYIVRNPLRADLRARGGMALEQLQREGGNDGGAGVSERRHGAEDVRPEPRLRAPTIRRLCGDMS
jgi:putative transposase